MRGIWTLLLALLLASPAAALPARISSSPQKAVPKLAVPDTIYAAAGHELNVWYDQLADNLFGLVTGAVHTLAGDSGATYDRCFRWSPVEEYQEQPYAVRSIGLDGEILASDSTCIAVVADTAGHGTKQALFIGDSLFAGGQVVTEMLSLFGTAGGAQLRLLGSIGTADSLHEGRAGARLTHLLTNDKWDFEYTDHLDFSQWMADSSYVGPIDYCVVHLGYNDLWALGDTPLSDKAADALMVYTDSLCNAILDADTGYPDCKVLLCVPALGCGSLSAFGSAYSAADLGADPRWRLWRRNVATFNQALLRHYDGGAFNSQVYVVPVGLAVDPLYAYPRVEENASDRTTIKVYRWTNFLHPTASGGYESMADGIYPELRRLLKDDYNLVRDSETFDDTFWTLTGGALPGDALTAPDAGAARSDTTIANTATFWTQIYEDTGIETAADNVFSCYFHKGAETPIVRLAIVDSDGSDFTTRFCQWAVNAVDGAVVQNYSHADSDSSTNHAGIDAGGGWVRVWFYAGCSGTQLGQAVDLSVYIAGNATTAARVVGTWGAQFEQGMKSPYDYVERR